MKTARPSERGDPDPSGPSKKETFRSERRAQPTGSAKRLPDGVDAHGGSDGTELPRWWKGFSPRRAALHHPRRGHVVALRERRWTLRRLES